MPEFDLRPIQITIFPGNSVLQVRYEVSVDGEKFSGGIAMGAEEVSIDEEPGLDQAIQAVAIKVQNLIRKRIGLSSTKNAPLDEEPL